MHMSDALVSPQVGISFWLVSGSAIGWSIVKMKKGSEDLQSVSAPLIGVTSALIFAAQMLNFSIPGTGSSGHLGGGFLLALLLGPYAGVIAMACILLIQALFFGDGGLLAYGCNVFNLGIIPSLVIYPLLHNLLWKRTSIKPSILHFSLISGGFLSMVLGAMMVVIQTKLSHITALSWFHFTACMIPIHMAIGLVEGIVTTIILRTLFTLNSTVWYKASQSLLPFTTVNIRNPKRILLGTTIVTFFCAGIVSWFASIHPDGLEWSLSKVQASEEIPDTPIHQLAQWIQKRITIFPDYSLSSSTEASEDSSSEAWPNVDLGTSIAGIVGAIMVLVVASLCGILMQSKNIDSNKNKVSSSANG